MKRFLKLMAASIIGSALTIAVFMITGINDNELTITKGQSNLPVHRTVYTVKESGEVVPLDFTGVSKEVMNSVVHIKSTRKIKGDSRAYYYDPFGDLWGDDFFKFFFGEPPQQRQERIKPEPFIQQGTGSGVIISSNGYIVTNNHVVADADEIEVTLHNNEVFNAKIIGTDPSTDIALIQIKSDGLQALPLGNSDNVEVGEWVLAVGNPFNLNSTVTAGIISAKGRNINIINDKSAIEAFIQTDAAINPGNSGGALVNLNGELIGINTAIASQTGVYMGYGFAIPVNLAKSVVDDFIKYGEVRRGYIGVSIEPMTQVKAEGVGLDKVRGVFISSVLNGKAADKAGIKAGDVILEVQGVEVNKPNQVQSKIGSYDPGEKISIVVWRDGSKKTFNIVLEGREEEANTASRTRTPVEKNINSLGITVGDLTSRDLERFDLDNGIVLQSVKRNSPASKEGLQRGDVIYEADGKPVSSAAEFRNYIEDLSKGDIIKLQVRNRDSSGNNFDRLVFLQIPKK